MEWPLKDEIIGKFRTTPTNMIIYKKAMEAVMAVQGDEAVSAELDERIENWMENMSNVKKWRDEYVDLVYEFGVITSLLKSSQVLVLAEAGLQALHESMLYRESCTNKQHDDETEKVSNKEDEKILPTAKQAFEPKKVSSSLGTWETKTFVGGKQTSDVVFHIPSPQDPQVRLEGDNAMAQVKAWVDYGCMEPSVSLHANKILQAKPEFLKEIVSDKVFVLLGVTSSIGPAKPLLSLHGAKVLGISRKGEKLQNLTEWFEKEGNSEATLQVPQDGADILQEGPQIAQWIVENIPPGCKHVVVCHLVYMDGEKHVRASVAMDLIYTHIANYCDEQNLLVSPAFLTSPSTVLTVPPAAALEAKRRYDSRPLWNSLTPLKPWDFNQRPYPVQNGLAHMQGPNYALAKTMQQWRCMLAACLDGRCVSAPCGPASRSDNMVSHSTMAAYLEGMQHLKPLLAFDIEPASALMTCILLSQVSSARPKQVEHPMHVVWDGSVHSGSWRCPYDSRSTGIMSVLLGKTLTSSHWVPVESLAKEDGSGTEQAMETEKDVSTGFSCGN